MTARSEADLKTQFSDNTSGAIGADDHEDFIDTLFQARTIKAHGNQFARETGAGRPTPVFIGASEGLQMDIGDEAYYHITLPEEIDPTKDIIVYVDWVPWSTESGKTVTWELSYLAMGSDGIQINTVDAKLSAVDEAVPSTQYEDTSTAFTIPAAHLSDGDHELKIRVDRIASTSDPATSPAIHHVYADIEVKWPGAT